MCVCVYVCLFLLQLYFGAKECCMVYENAVTVPNMPQALTLTLNLTLIVTVPNIPRARTEPEPAAGAQSRTFTPTSVSAWQCCCCDTSWMCKYLHPTCRQSTGAHNRNLLRPGAASFARRDSPGCRNTERGHLNCDGDRLRLGDALPVGPPSRRIPLLPT